MFRHAVVLLALSACGRIGFTDGAGDDATTAMADSAPALGTITCPVTRTPIPDADGVELFVEGAPTPLVAWRTSAMKLSYGVLDANDVVAMQRVQVGASAERIVGAFPIASGHALAFEDDGLELLYAVSPDLATATLRASAPAGVGRNSLTGFGSFVFWGHVVTGTPNALLFERLDGDAIPTPQSNRTTGANVRELVIGGATDSHAHLVWSEADDTCSASELFGGVAPLSDVAVKPGCRSPRNAAGTGDSIATIYTTPAGALRFFGISTTYDHDIELSPGAHDPSLADDGSVVWATWFDDRVGGALVLAKVEVTTTEVTVTARQLLGVTPTAAAGVAMVGDASPARLLILEAGSIAVVEPCL